MTWAIPISVFFTSIIGWQYFTGGRTVPAGKCYVQYMEDAVFNCILQVHNSSLFRLPVGYSDIVTVVLEYTDHLANNKEIFQLRDIIFECQISVVVFAVYFASVAA